MVDLFEKKGELLLVLILVVVLLVIFGCMLILEEYKVVVEGIDLIKFVSGKGKLLDILFVYY